MDFPTFHRYNTLVRRGQADPLTCNICKGEYILRLGPKDEPLLQCLTCNTRVVPGLNIEDKVREVLERIDRV